MINIAILASGEGTNALKLLEKAEYLDNICVKTLITDKENVGVLEIAKKYHIPTHTVLRNKLTQVEHEIEIIKLLNSYKVQWIFLAGYMRILSSGFIKRFYDIQIRKSRIINIHPSLLPAYKGLNAFKRAFKDNVQTSGITVHFVNDVLDGGEIIKQQAFHRKEEDTFKDFVTRGKKIEHSIYPEVLELLSKNQLKARMTHENRHNQ